MHALTKAAIIAMIAGVTVFTEGDSGRYRFDFDPEFELPVAFISFVIVCVFQVKVFRNWWANGCVRDFNTIWASACVAATGTYAAWHAFWRVEFNPILGAAALIPAGVAAVSALVALVLCFFARRPSLWRSGWNGPPTATLATLPPELATTLRQDREEAMEILVERGLLDLDDTELRRLAQAPLGRLDKI